MSTASRHAAALFVLPLALCASTLRAQTPDPVNNPTIDYVEPERERVTSGLPDPMPAIPAESALHAFEAGANSPNQFAVDPASLLVRGDSLVQFTLVVTSPSGVRNIGYEALDCEKARVGLLATGQDGHGWTPVRQVRWREVRTGDTRNAHYHELFRRWCDGAGVAGGPKQLVGRLETLPQRYRY